MAESQGLAIQLNGTEVPIERPKTDPISELVEEVSGEVEPFVPRPTVFHPRFHTSLAVELAELFAQGAQYSNKTQHKLHNTRNTLREIVEILKKREGLCDGLLTHVKELLRHLSAYNNAVFSLMNESVSRSLEVVSDYEDAHKTAQQPLDERLSRFATNTPGELIRAKNLLLVDMMPEPQRARIASSCEVLTGLINVMIGRVSDLEGKPTTFLEAIWQAEEKRKNISKIKGTIFSLVKRLSSITDSVTERNKRISLCHEMLSKEPIEQLYSEMMNQLFEMNNEIAEVNQAYRDLESAAEECHATFLDFLDHCFLLNALNFSHRLELTEIQKLSARCKTLETPIHGMRELVSFYQTTILPEIRRRNEFDKITIARREAFEDVIERESVREVSRRKDFATSSSLENFETLSILVEKPAPVVETFITLEPLDLSQSTIVNIGDISVVTSSALLALEKAELEIEHFEENPRTPVLSLRETLEECGLHLDQVSSLICPQKMQLMKDFVQESICVLDSFHSQSFDQTLIHLLTVITRRAELLIPPEGSESSLPDHIIEGLQRVITHVDEINQANLEKIEVQTIDS